MERVAEGAARVVAYGEGRPTHLTVSLHRHADRFSPLDEDDEAGTKR